jgi:class 3 adenylate cyclase
VDNRPIENAEAMPILYRVVLDRVAELERYDRPRAARFRRAAIRAYSTAWNRAEHARLQFIAGQIEGRLSRHRRPAGDTSPRFAPIGAVTGRLSR